jgi:hypothetical protein
MSVTGNAEAAQVEWTARAVMQGLQLIFATYVADKQFELAQQYSDRATQALNSQLALAGAELAMKSHDNSMWFSEGSPCLSGFIAEVCGKAEYQPNYNEEASRTVSTIRAAGSIAAKKVFECADTYCIGMSQHAINEIAFKEAALATEAVNFAFRREEVDTERKNAVRLANKAQAIAMRKNSMNGSSAGLGGVAQAFASMANKAGEGLNSSLQSLGFNGQQLVDTLIKGPPKGAFEPPVNNDPVYESNREMSSLASRYPAPVGVDAMGVPSASSAGSWGSNPMQGVKGTSGSESTGTDTTGENINGFW